MSEFFDKMMAGKTAEELKAMAGAERQEAEDSFQRCDTDGFLSQWANGLTAELYSRQAEIVKNNGKADFIGLYEGERRVKAREISVKNKFAPWTTDYVWLVDDSDPVATKRKFIPTGEKSRVQKSLGLSERKESDTAKAEITGRGTGLSGSAWVITVRTGDKWGGTAELVKS